MTDQIDSLIYTYVPPYIQTRVSMIVSLKKQRDVGISHRLRLLRMIVFFPFFEHSVSWKLSNSPLNSVKSVVGLGTTPSPLPPSYLSNYSNGRMGSY